MTTKPIKLPCGITVTSDPQVPPGEVWAVHMPSKISDIPPPPYTAYWMRDGVMVKAAVVGMCMEIDGTLRSDGTDSDAPIVMVDFQRHQFQRHGGPVAPFPRWWWTNDTVKWEPVDVKPIDLLDVEYDGVTLRELVERYEVLQRDDTNSRWAGTHRNSMLTTTQRAAVSAHWSAQLRAKVAASKAADRNGVLVDLQDEP